MSKWSSADGWPLLNKQNPHCSQSLSYFLLQENGDSHSQAGSTTSGPVQMARGHTSTTRQAKPTLLRIPAETFSRSLLVMFVMLMMLILILLILGELIMIVADDVDTDTADTGRGG